MATKERAGAANKRYIGRVLSHKEAGNICSV
jgi:hypothetical protein